MSWALLGCKAVLESLMFNDWTELAAEGGACSPVRSKHGMMQQHAPPFAAHLPCMVAQPLTMSKPLLPVLFSIDRAPPLPAIIKLHIPSVSAVAVPVAVHPPPGPPLVGVVAAGGVHAAQHITQ